MSKIKPVTCAHFEICRRVMILLFPENYLLTIAIVTTQNFSYLNKKTPHFTSGGLLMILKLHSLYYCPAERVLDKRFLPVLPLSWCVSLRRVS